MSHDYCAVTQSLARRSGLSGANSRKITSRRGERPYLLTAEFGFPGSLLYALRNLLPCLTARSYYAKCPCSCKRRHLRSLKLSNFVPKGSESKNTSCSTTLLCLARRPFKPSTKMRRRPQSRCILKACHATTFNIEYEFEIFCSSKEWHSKIMPYDYLFIIFFCNQGDAGQCAAAGGCQCAHTEHRPGLRGVAGPEPGPLHAGLHQDGQAQEAVPLAGGEHRGL